MRNESINAILGDLRTDGDVDHTLQNLLQALTQNLELRARYRVFEFEARQEGLDECAPLFNDLRRRRERADRRPSSPGCASAWPSRARRSRMMTTGWPFNRRLVAVGVRTEATRRTGHDAAC